MMANSLVPSEFFFYDQLVISDYSFVFYFFVLRLYQSLKKPINTLVFQDLGALGFGLASRELGMDETHAVLVLKRLAQFHSISVLVNQKVSSLTHLIGL